MTPTILRPQPRDLRLARLIRQSKLASKRALADAVRIAAAV